MCALKKRDQRITAAVGDEPPGGGQFALAHPALWEHLTALHFDDGTPRLPSTLTIFVDAGAVKACLNDRDQGMTGWAAGDSVAACLMSLERALQAETVDWRVSGKKGGKKR